MLISRTSGAVVAIVLAGCAPAAGEDAAPGSASPEPSFRCSVASVTDGDTLRCVESEAGGRQIRVRLSGIAARERDGSCSAGHPCPDASAEAATAELERLVAGAVLSCSLEGTTYGRRAAFCQTSAGVDVSCAMLASRTVARWDRYWGDHQCRPSSR